MRRLPFTAGRGCDATTPSGSGPLRDEQSCGLLICGSQRPWVTKVVQENQFGLSPPEDACDRVTDFALNRAWGLRLRRKRPARRLDHRDPPVRLDGEDLDLDVFHGGVVPVWSLP